MNLKKVTMSLRKALDSISADEGLFYIHESSLQFLLAKELSSYRDIKVTIEQHLVNGRDEQIAIVDILTKEQKNAFTAIELKYYTTHRKMGRDQAFHCLNDIKKSNSYINNVYPLLNSTPIKASYCIVVIEDKGVSKFKDNYKNVFNVEGRVMMQRAKFIHRNNKKIIFRDLDLTWVRYGSFKYFIIHNIGNS